MLPRLSKHSTWRMQVWQHLFLFNLGWDPKWGPRFPFRPCWGSKKKKTHRKWDAQRQKGIAAPYRCQATGMACGTHTVGQEERPRCGCLLVPLQQGLFQKSKDSDPSVLHKISCSISFFECHLLGSIILLECNILNGWVCQSLFGEPIYSSRNHCSTWWETSVAIHKYSIPFEQDQHLISSPSRALQTRSLNLWSWWARGNNRIWMIILFRKWWLEPSAQKNSLVLQGTSNSPLEKMSHSQSQM